MPISSPVDGFRLAYDDHPGAGGPAVLLHGWPGDRNDHRELVARLSDRCRLVVPDLRGFGESEGPAGSAPSAFAAEAQARSVLGLVEELALGPVVLAGYDVGSRIAQAAARARPDLVRALVVSPPVPGVGERVLSPQARQEFWYQPFHRLDLAEQLLDGNREAIRAYLAHFWSHWSGPDFEPEPAELDRLADAYARPGAFVASINWYRAGSGAIARSLAEEVPPPGDRLAVPVAVLWPDHDPLFPQAWSDRVEQFFSDVQVRLLAGVGHFAPLEAPDTFAAAILERATRPGAASGTP
jgi:pimeloyl-ACP methyl ester carboxylesterase